MKAIISGFPGQDACYLADFLLKGGYEVHGIVKRYTAPNYSNLEYMNLLGRIRLHTGDVTDIGSIMNIIREVQPDEFYNLAAQSYVGDSWQLANVTTQVDAMGPLNCLTAIQHIKPDTKFYQAGTSEMFGNSNINGFQTEETPFMPVSPYGVAKLYGYHITRNFRESHDAFACSGILFNHESPIRGIQFVTRKVTNAVAKFKTGKKKTVLKMGNLDARRDWGHAEDFVEAMWLMMQQEKPDDFIVATGINYSVRDLLDVAFQSVGLNWHEYVDVDPVFIRPNELHSLCAKSDKAKTVLNWEPKWTFEEMIHVMVREDIRRLE